jgi:UDP-N-acetylmuramate dehydrogenase
MNIKENFSLKSYNTFGVDVKAKLFAEVFTKEELQEIIDSDDYKSTGKFILGGGSNVLFTKDILGLVIKISIPGIKIIDEDSESIIVEAGAGAIWHKLVMFAVENSFGGIENLSLIPGEVGAAPMQNIGAYGQELSETFHSLEGVYHSGLGKAIFYKDDCKFGYRDSIFKNELKGKFVITSVKLKLNKNPQPNLSYASVKEEIEKLNLQKITIKDVSDVVCKIRRAKLPDPKVIGNAGSFFKNPEIPKNKYEELQKDYPEIPGYNVDEQTIKVPAAWLIEKSGLKGKRNGDTGTHQNQPLVLVNYGNAKGSEIISFAEEIKSSIKEKFGIALNEEVNVY